MLAFLQPSGLNTQAVAAHSVGLVSTPTTESAAPMTLVVICFLTIPTIPSTSPTGDSMPKNGIGRIDKPMLVALTLWGYTHGAIQIAQTKESFLEEVGLSADEFLAHAIRFGLRGLEPPAATPARSTVRTKPSRSRR